MKGAIAGLALLLSVLAPVPVHAADTAGKDGKKMALIHLLVRAGRHEEAARALRSLYPEGAPRGGAEALEYYSILGNSSSGWNEARQGLAKLAKSAPDNLDYQLALAQVLTKRTATRRTGMGMFATMAGRPGLDKKQVLDAWLAALSGLDNSAPDSIGYYRQYLKVDPDNIAMRDSLAMAERAEAQRLPWELRDKADKELAAGHPEQAAATLKRAMQLDPKNAWVRFDLARLYHKRGDEKEGRALMDEGVSVAPGSADMLYADALYVSLLDETEDALKLINQIPPAKRSSAMRDLQRKLNIQLQTKKAISLEHDGHIPEMNAAMKQAEAGAGKDPELVHIVADAWVDLKHPDHAVSLMRRAMLASSSTDARLYYAEVLNRAEWDRDLGAVLHSISRRRGLSDANRADLRYLTTSLAARKADNARHAGNFKAAYAALRPALKQYPENTDLLMALARIHSSKHEPQEAAQIYRKILKNHPDYTGARLALAWSLNDAGDKAGAHKEMETALVNVPTNDIGARLDVAGWYLDNGEPKKAASILRSLRESAPDDDRILIMSGRIAKANGDYSEAIGYFRKAGAKDEVTKIENTRATGYVATGIDFLSKTDGAPGISNLQALELPVEMRLPLGYGGGLAFVQVDPVIADAGTLNLGDTYNLYRVGTVLAAGGTTNAASQSARGTAYAVGYEGDGLRADIGTTPLGFPVSDVVGGVKWSHYTATSGFSFDLSRRPVTSSLLSYAGMHDPVTDKIWGGVRSTGASLHLSQDVGRLSGFVDAGYYRLTGKNVLSNAELSLRTGFDWSFIDSNDMRLTAGLALWDWSFRENLRYYTFGHGGYYSPQRYYSLSLPVRWTGRRQTWSYLLQASVSASVSYEKDMPFYPTDSTLQSQGVTNSALATPVYSGGNGRGTGYSLTGALERKFSSRLFVGGRFEIDRSAYYAPNFGIIYLRYWFDAVKGAVPYPPDPVRPYSRY